MSKNSKKSNNLYTDDNPKYTISGTGYKDINAVNKTINLIKNRSIKYQKAVMVTLYNRAKYHKYKTPQMIQAMKLIKNWLVKNKNVNRKYPYLKLDLINKYEKLADKYNISKVARGLKKPIKSEKGFLQIYRESKGNFGKLSFIPIFTPGGTNSNHRFSQDYDILRQKFLNARLGQMQKTRSPLYYNNGKYKNLPTKQHLVLIMNGYSPDVAGINRRLKLLDQLDQ